MSKVLHGRVWRFEGILDVNWEICARRHILHNWLKVTLLFSPEKVLRAIREQKAAHSSVSCRGP